MSNPQEISSAAQAKANEGAQSAKVTANEVRENAVAAAIVAKNKTEEAATVVKDKTVEAAESAKETVQPKPEPNVFQKAGGQAMNVGQGAVDTVKNTLGFGDQAQKK